MQITIIGAGNMARGIATWTSPSRSSVRRVCASIFLADALRAAPQLAPAQGLPRQRDLYVDSGHLRRLIGRPTTSLHDAVDAALA
jgi:3-hydroxyacyl-CoA dehydrogenase